MDSFIQIKDLNFKYGTFTKSSFELQNINLNISKNKFTILMGKSGSGKSTLAKILTGLEPSYNGKVKIKGQDIKKINTIRDLISISFQFPENQFFLDSVIDELTFGLKIRKFTVEKIIKKVTEVCKLTNFPIDKYQHYSPFDLSSGFQRRLALGIVLSLDTEIVILDEPLCGIDNVGRKIFLKLFQKLKNKMTIIYITHTPEEVFFLTDNIIILDKGKIVFNKKKNDLLKMKNIPENIIQFLPENFWFSNMYKKSGVKLKQYYYSPKNLAKELVKNKDIC